jgi:hypothetical protein
VGEAGVDLGKGGKYLILPPDYDGTVPDGYIPNAARTVETYALLRSNTEVDGTTGIAKSVAYAKRIRLYPLAQEGRAPDTVFVDAVDQVYDATIPMACVFTRP